MKPLAYLLALTWASLWFTPDQQGRRHFEKGEFKQAAASFQDPMWQGIAWYRAGDFEKAAAAFSRRDTPDGWYNQGNARMLLGKYDAAVKCFDKAIAGRPGWQEAIDNREIARLRAELVKQKGGDMGDQQIGADEIVFDKDAKSGGEKTEIDDAKPLDSTQVQAMWLRRIQTRPADFLRAKFAFQYGEQEEAP
ncbi:tetratricopeptide repeat protein [Luteolibacter marinus]|uniref:tetratricopeptide repeat protein n=1 Tax=Luteolibacter marinus TaxID=2776705 RepID=UPI0018675550|nr:tetratricopeptide repeat protein [Luteolibacter marinus]